MKTEITKHHDQFFTAKISEEKHVRLTIGLTTNNVFITEYNPKYPYNDNFFQLLLNDTQPGFIGKEKDLFSAFQKWLNNYQS